MKSGGDATPCKSHKEKERGSLFLAPATSVVAEAFSMCRCKVCNRTAVTTGSRVQTVMGTVIRQPRALLQLGGYDDRRVSRPERVLCPCWAPREVAL